MTPLERVRSALEQHGSHREGPHGWQCPAHHDQHASLSLTEGKDGRALLRCHAGCDPNQVVATLGLTMADLFPPKQQGRAARGTIVATYDYTDEHGTLLYQTVRYAPKDFRQRRPDGHGGWIWNLKGARRVLYHLPKLQEATRRGDTIWLCEGEKDVHALEQAGVTATTAPMGAGKWRHDYTEQLAGTNLTLVADSDETGRRHALDVAQRLTQAGCSVRIVQAAHGKDPHDHLAAGLTLDQFQPIDPAELADAQATTTSTGPTVQDLVDTLASYQHLDDPGHVWFALAVAVSGYAFDQEPLWGMLIGAPSSGKTETARALGNLAGHIDDLTASSLLSWTKGKEPKPTGVLVRIGKRGLVTIGDFSTVLAMSNKGGRDLLFAMLRRVYDGHLTRDLGTAPEQLRWHGRITLLACCTPIIDDYSSHADALGPRWLYYRIHTRDTHTKRAMGLASRAPKQEGRDQAATLAEQLVERAVEAARHVQVSEPLYAALVDLAIVCCRGRAAIPRASYGRREITGDAITEDPPRLTGQLAQLAHALLALGLDQAGTFALCRRAALDSIPQVRRRVLEVLAGGEKLGVSEIARRVETHRHVARFALEDLAAAGVLSYPDAYDEDDQGENRWAVRTWQLDGPDTDLIASVIDQTYGPVDKPSTTTPWQEKVVMDLSSLSGETRARETTHAQLPFAARDDQAKHIDAPSPEPDQAADGRIFADPTEQNARSEWSGGARVYQCNHCGHRTAPALTDMTGLPHSGCRPYGRFQPAP